MWLATKYCAIRFFSSVIVGLPLRGNAGGDSNEPREGKGRMPKNQFSRRTFFGAVGGAISTGAVLGGLTQAHPRAAEGPQGETLALLRKIDIA